MLTKLFAKYLFPKEMAASVYAINYEKLWRRGIRGLIFDIDNTLATYDIPHPTPKVISFLDGLAARGFAVCLLSNNGKKRVVGFCRGMSYPHVWKAGKPKARGIASCLRHMGLDKAQVALIGDQIFTDCLGGNLFGVYTVLTTPIAKRDEWTVRLKRWPEKPVLWAYRRQNGRN